jgi:hypothetical protein
MTLKKSVISLFVIAVIIAISSCANKTSAPVPNTIISGNVSRQVCCSGPYSSVNGADVDLYQAAVIQRHTFTNSGGYYIFNYVIPGTYDVVATTHNDFVFWAQGSLNAGGWSNLPYGDFSSGTSMTQTAITVASGDHVSVDFRFTGY